jgi:hypothetical protein
MEMNKKAVERLAKAWLAEAKRLRASGACDCGCGATISMRTRFKRGHDAKLLREYRQRIGTILADEADRVWSIR